LSSTSPCELPEREVTLPSNLKVVRALDFSFKELAGRSGRRQREAGRFQWFNKKFAWRFDSDVTLSKIWLMD